MSETSNVTPSGAKSVGQILAGETLEQRLERFAKLAPPSPEEIAARTAQAEREREAQRAHRVESLLAEANLPKRHAELADPDRRGPWGQAEQKVLGLLGTGCLVGLVGAYGPGKTQLCVEAIRHEIEKNLRSAQFITLTELFMRIKAAYRKDSPQTELEIIKQFRKPKLLAIEEVSKIADTDWEQRMFFELINKRYDDKTDTLLTANVSAAEFEKFIGPALARRMRETGGIIVFDWPSFR